MPFGPFISQEEKNKINNAHRTNYPGGGNLPGIGPFVSPAERRQINTALQDNYGKPQREKAKQQQQTQSDVSKYKPTSATNPLAWLGQWMQQSIDRNSTGVPGAAEMMSGQRPTKTSSDTQDSSPKSSEPPATAEPPKNKPNVENYTVAGVEYDGNTGRPVGAPEGGYSLEPDGSMTPHSPSGSGGSDSRTNANGLQQYGQTLGGLNKFTSAFTGGYELTDIKSAFQSNALPTTPSGEKQGHEGTRTNYSWDSEGETGVWDDEKGMLIQPSAPGTTGSTPDNAQDGTSSKPDVADNIRAVRMERQSGRGSRRDPRNRGADSDMFGGPEPSDASLTSPMYANSKRNAIRSAFLDTNLSSVKAAVAANAVAGYGKDSNGNARFNYGGKLVYAKPGMEQKAKNAAMMGQDPSQYLDIPATADTQPDTPAASELSITPQSTVKPGTITAPENTGGSIDAPEPITKPSPEKYKETQDFLTKNMEMLNRRTK